MSTVVLALGSNLGDRAANLVRAVERLRAGGVAIERASSAWETPPVPADQPPFLNAVVVGKTALSPHALLALAKEVEWGLGRRPGRRWGPRPVDVDILFYDEQQVETEDLTVPHPRIAERAFVVVPLAEVMEGELPVLGKTATALLADLDTEGITRTGVKLLPGGES